MQEESTCLEKALLWNFPYQDQISFTEVKPSEKISISLDEQIRILMRMYRERENDPIRARPYKGPFPTESVEYTTSPS